MTPATFFIDLDDTIYPPSSGIWSAIRERINRYMIERIGITPDLVPELRLRLFETYGTTLRGLTVENHIDPEDYLSYVHDVPIEAMIQPDPGLGAVLRAYPQRKLIFTNADTRHANRVLAALGLCDCFEAVIDIHQISPACKPQPAAFQVALRLAGNPDPSSCMMVDDSVRVIETAFSFGMQAILLSPDLTRQAPFPVLSSLKDLPTLIPLTEQTDAV